MEELLQTFKQIEDSYKQKKGYLRNVKLSFIGAIIMCFVYLSFRALSLHKRYDFTLKEILAMELGVIILFLVPVVFAPLYTFFSSKLHNRFNWDIKMTIFNSILGMYDIEYKVSFSNQLSDADIKDLRFNNSLISFVNGDDLIFGHSNDFKFRIAEMHSRTLFKKKFDGIVGVLIFSDIEICNKEFERISSVKNAEVDVVHNKNKIYLMKRGRKEHFEFKFKGSELNKEKLILDYNDFKMLADSMFRR